VFSRDGEEAQNDNEISELITPRVLTNDIYHVVQQFYYHKDSSTMVFHVLTD